MPVNFWIERKILLKQFSFSTLSHLNLQKREFVDTQFNKKLKRKKFYYSSQFTDLQKKELFYHFFLRFFTRATTTALINISAVVVALVKILAVTSMNISNTHMGFRS